MGYGRHLPRNLCETLINWELSLATKIMMFIQRNESAHAENHFTPNKELAFAIKVLTSIHLYVFKATCKSILTYANMQVNFILCLCSYTCFWKQYIKFR